MTRYGGGIHPDDDVARNIKAEQNRDAAPSAAEARREAEQHMRSEGCWVENCDVNDPDVLRPYQTRLGHNCSACQHPPRADPGFACPDHRYSTASRRAHGIARWLRETEDAEHVVWYECDLTEKVAREPHPEPVMAEHGRSVVPDVALRHERCEHAVQAILYADGTTVGDVPAGDVDTEGDDE